MKRMLCSAMFSERLLQPAPRLPCFLSLVWAAHCSWSWGRRLKMSFLHAFICATSFHKWMPLVPPAGLVDMLSIIYIPSIPFMCWDSECLIESRVICMVRYTISHQRNTSPECVWLCPSVPTGCPRKLGRADPSMRVHPLLLFGPQVHA